MIGAGEPVAVPSVEEGGLPPDALRTERTIAIIRIAVVFVVAIVYLSSIGIQRAFGPLAVSILALAALYGLWALLARPYESGLPSRVRAASLLVDAALITLWCDATGGPSSEFWTLYLILLIAVALRFDLLETLAGALGLALLYVTVMSATGGLSRSELLVRPALILITGFAVGVLARERRLHQEAQEAMERIAEEGRRALVAEKATVARLQQVDLAKTEFVAVASHEFRTPLAGIIGVLSTLRSHGDQIDEALRAELLEGASAQATRLARLVDDLLTVSRIEGGALPLEIAPVHPERLVFEAARAAGATDLLDVEMNGIDRVICDPDRIIRVLTNLFDNARKYSPPGGRIALVVEDEGDAFRFTVRDTGPGIPSQLRQEIFERFRRLIDEANTPGSGLGLYISRCLVEAHGGTISVEEAPGGGAEFSFTLPKASRVDSKDDAADEAVGELIGEISGAVN
jgi:signal transduction histidine kinase